MSKTVRKQQNKAKRKTERYFRRLIAMLILLFTGCAVTKVQINLAHKDVEVQVEMR